MISGNRDMEHGIRSLIIQAETLLDPEFVRALRVCDAASVLDGALTFLPDASLPPAQWSADWQTWLNGLFAQVIAPVLLSAAKHAQSGQFREIAALDQDFTSSLEEQINSRNTIAGCKMLKRLSGTRGVRWLDRLQAAAEAGSSPGHFAVAYGCQGALFHVTPRLLLATYAFWEWSTAVVACRQSKKGAVAAFQTFSAPVLRRITEELLSSLSTRFDESSRASL